MPFCWIIEVTNYIHRVANDVAMGKELSGMCWLVNVVIAALLPNDDDDSISSTITRYKARCGNPVDGYFVCCLGNPDEWENVTRSIDKSGIAFGSIIGFHNCLRFSRLKSNTKPVLCCFWHIGPRQPVKNIRKRNSKTESRERLFFRHRNIFEENPQHGTKWTEEYFAVDLFLWISLHCAPAGARLLLETLACEMKKKNVILFSVNR